MTIFSSDMVAAACSKTCSFCICRSIWHFWYSALVPHVHGATPPDMSEVAVSGTVRTV